LSIEELRSSADTFPIEFHDIRERHSILFGEDLVADIEIHSTYYRAQVEHELRSKLLRLRQKAGGLLSDDALLLRLMVDSVSTFCVLLRHVLRLEGEAPRYNKREIVHAACARFSIEREPFDTLLDVREGKRKPKQVTDPAGLLGRYLSAIGSVISAVDRMQELR
jgi:hypothetical protein